jgi:triphosphoribosyl-dephospho-CoA synthase
MNALDVGQAWVSPGKMAAVACILEATARKPGNVHRYADFADAGYLDYVMSALAIVEPLNEAGSLGVGQAVLRAIEATRRVVATNTNLGMVLLLAPLAAVSLATPLRSGVASVLDRLTVADARDVYRAIRLARPAGLGSVTDQDVSLEPTVTLGEAMRMAAERDSIARQYANGYAEIFDLALPAFESALGTGQPLEAAIITSFLVLLADRPDSLIERKLGRDTAFEASRLAGELLAAGPVDVSSSDFQAFDAWLRADGHARNPGTTADLIAAALFAALRTGTIAMPIRVF